tara:strand:- start:1436 stop:1831 length:396 start_codon:yes stop_codon:yes gene_type:complete
MNYAFVMIKKFPNKDWSIIDTYESLKWNATDEPKPTDEDLKELWEELKNEYYLKDIRQKRDNLLSSSDKYCLVDWPQTVEQKESRLQYRQSLRDLPSLYLDKMTGDYTFIEDILYVGDISYNFMSTIPEPL